MFGMEDAALKSPGNGLFMNGIIEKFFDCGWVAIVPRGSIEQTPTEWKMVAIDDQISENAVYQSSESDNEIVRWRVSFPKKGGIEDL